MLMQRIGGWKIKKDRIFAWNARDPKKGTVQESLIYVLNAIVDSLTRNPPRVLVSPRSTNMPPPSLNIDSLTPQIMATLKKSIGVKYPTLTYSSVEARARISAWLENVKALAEQGRDYFLSTSVRSNKNVLTFLSGRMLKAFSRSIEDSILQQSSLSFPKQGILSGGKFSTPKISVSLKTESASLSSVVETQVPEKYFLSDKM